MNHVSLGIFNLIVELGAVQGIVMALVLCFLHAKDNSKTIFCFILLTLALLSVKISLHTLDLWDLPLFHLFPLAIDTTLPPLFYLYICAITANEIKGGRVILYFIPTIVFMLYALVVYAYALPLHDIELKDQLAAKFSFNQVKDIEDFVAVISAIIYWLLGYNRISRYRKWLFDSQSDNRLQEFTWLRNMLAISGILVLAITVVVLLEDVLAVGRNHFIHLEIFYIYLALITYYLSFKGHSLYCLPRVFATNTETPVPAQIANTSQSVELTLPKANEDYLIIKGLILHSLETDKIYLNAELSIKEMAQHIGYPVAIVSAVINSTFQMNFRNLVNKYRVEEAKSRLINPPSHLSILGIALDCGFNSEASFYRIFRQETGLSPNEYIKENK